MRETSPAPGVMSFTVAWYRYPLPPVVGYGFLWWPSPAVLCVAAHLIAHGILAEMPSCTDTFRQAVALT